jgi:hypothetical protein
LIKIFSGHKSVYHTQLISVIIKRGENKCDIAKYCNIIDIILSGRDNQCLNAKCIS